MSHYIEPILQATDKVLTNMFQIEPEQGELEVTEEAIATNKANISIGVTGDLEGAIIYSFSEEMALDMVTEMSGMEIEELDKFVTSAIGELANIISGNAMTDLNQEGYECDIAPPQVIIGQGQTVSMATDKVVTVPLETKLGQFVINLAIIEG